MWSRQSLLWRGPRAQAKEGLWGARWLLEPPRVVEDLSHTRGSPAGPGAAGELNYSGEEGGKLNSGVTGYNLYSLKQEVSRERW